MWRLAFFTLIWIASAQVSAHADVVLPCPPKPEQPCDDCVAPPGTAPPEHPIYQSPCWANRGEAATRGADVAPSEPPQVPALDDYVGTYVLTPQSDLEIFLRKGRLFAKSKYQPATVLTRVSDDRFVAEAVAAYFDFERDGAGRVVAVAMDQAEKVIRAPRR